MPIFGVGWPMGISNPATHAQAIRNTGCTEVRIPLRWAVVEATHNTYDWSTIDLVVSECAKKYVSVLPIIYYTPAWMAKDPRTPPDAQAYGAFCSAVAQRYKPGGVFWQANPTLPQLGIRHYEIWNEPNNQYHPLPNQAYDTSGFDWSGSVAQYANIYAHARSGIKAQGSSLEAIIGGLAYVNPCDGQPADEYLRELIMGYLNPADVDAVGHHPYGADSSDEIGNYSRTILRLKSFQNTMNSLGLVTQGYDITEDGIQTSYSEQWDRYNYLHDIVWTIKTSYQRVRRFHVYTWCTDPAWQIAEMNGDWKIAAYGLRDGILA